MKDMGSLNDLMTLIPIKIRNKMKLKNFDVMKIDWYEAIINSMTENERENQKLSMGVDDLEYLRVADGHCKMSTPC